METVDLEAFRDQRASFADLRGLLLSARGPFPEVRDAVVCEAAAAAEAVADSLLRHPAAAALPALSCCGVQ